MIPHVGKVDFIVVVGVPGVHLEPGGCDSTTTSAPAAGALEVGVVTITAGQIRCGTEFSVSGTTDTGGREYASRGPKVVVDHHRPIFSASHIVVAKKIS